MNSPAFPVAQIVDAPANGDPQDGFQYLSRVMREAAAMPPVVVSRMVPPVRPQTVFLDRERLAVGTLTALDGNEHVWIAQFANRYAELRTHLTHQLERYALALQPRGGVDALPSSLRDRTGWKHYVR